MGTQQFCLKWNNHTTNMLGIFEQLLSSEALVDVTLACDGLSLKAHKMVLSACSPFFQSIFLENPCKHPIVILKDMRYMDLKAIIDFMYRGEVNVSQDQLSALLKTAETLKVKGLAEVTNEQRQGASGVIQQEISQQTSATQPMQPGNVQNRPESPLLSRRKRGRPRRRSLSDSNRSDNEDQIPAKVKAPDSPELVEDLSKDDTDISSEIRQRLNAANSLQSQVTSLPIPHTSSVSNQKSTASSIQDSKVTIEEPPSGDEVEFEMEPSKLMEQSMITEHAAVFSDGQSPSSLPAVSSQLAITPVGLETSLQKADSCSDSQALISCSLTSEPSTSSPLDDTPQDIKPSALVPFEEPPVSPVAGPSHQDNNSMVMYMETSAVSAIPGPSNYQMDKQSQSTPGNPSQGSKSEKKNRLYRCEICFKDFTTNFSMRRHVSIHNPAFHKYQCQLCPRRFNWFDNMRAHMKLMHGIHFQSVRRRGRVKEVAF